MTEEADPGELLDRLHDEYPDRHALDAQPAWVEALADVHDSIELAYVRERDSTPEPKIELKVMNTVSEEAGWHRIEAAPEEWLYPHEHPPAGVAAALEWLQGNVPVTEFRGWFDDR